MKITAKQVMQWCTAQHPTQANKSGNARGRKLHRTKDGSKTICNMIVEPLNGNAERLHFLANGKCKICFK